MRKLEISNTDLNQSGQNKVQDNVSNKVTVAEVLNQFKSAFDSVANSVLPNTLINKHSVHDKDGRILYASPNLPSVFGLENTEYSTIKVLDHVHVQDRVAVAHAVIKCAKRDDITPVEFRTIMAGRTSNNSDKPQWLELSLKKIETCNADEPLIVATYTDITKRKQIETDILATKEDAEHASDAKTRFLGHMSHELRTPLNAIMGFSELLNSHLAAKISTEKKAEYVELIHSSASHLLSVLNDILDMSKIESGMYEILAEPFALRNCLSKTVAMMQGQAQIRSIKLQSIGFDDVPDIVADERAIRQIMINLLSNAIKFSDDNSVVSVVAERTARNICLKIEDDGIGISEEHIENLGNPFYQADSKYDRKYEGTGLGLSVVRGLLQLHEGNIEFSSVRGKGTTVTVTLPIHGQSGRRVPAQDPIEQITEIHKKSNAEHKSFNIVRDGVPDRARNSA